MDVKRSTSTSEPEVKSTFHISYLQNTLKMLNLCVIVLSTGLN